VFELVAEAKSEETFIALCLLSVTGASLLTQRMGFSDTLGAFAAGVLLSGEPSRGGGLGGDHGGVFQNGELSGSFAAGLLLSGEQGVPGGEGRPGR